MTTDLTPILTGILSATASALNAAERPAGLVHLAPGREVAWDSCESGGGQLWVRVIDVFPTAGHGSAFPAFDSAQRGNCPTLLGVQIGLGVMRCAHTIDDRGVSPTAAQMSGDASATYADMGIMLDVLSCEVRSVRGVEAMKLGRWIPQGPLGGCVGGEWTATLAVNPCIDCG